MWKLGKIIAIPKPEQPLNEGSSYRLITLLSSVVKVLVSLSYLFSSFSSWLTISMASVKTEAQLQLFVSCRRPLLRVLTVKDRTSGPLWSRSIVRKLSTTLLLQDVHVSILPNTIGYLFTSLIVSPRSNIVVLLRV